MWFTCKTPAALLGRMKPSRSYGQPDIILLSRPQPDANVLSISTYHHGHTVELNHQQRVTVGNIGLHIDGDSSDRI